MVEVLVLLKVMIVVEHSGDVIGCIGVIEDLVEAKLSSISTSPEREDTILLEDPFNN